MHKTSPFWYQKSKHFLGRGTCAPQTPSQWGGYTPSVHCTIRCMRNGTQQNILGLGHVKAGVFCIHVVTDIILLNFFNWTVLYTAAGWLLGVYIFAKFSKDNCKITKDLSQLVAKTCNKSPSEKVEQRQSGMTSALANVSSTAVDPMT